MNYQEAKEKNRLEFKAKREALIADLSKRLTVAFPDRPVAVSEHGTLRIVVNEREGEQVTIAVENRYGYSYSSGVVGLTVQVAVGYGRDFRPVTYQVPNDAPANFAGIVKRVGLALTHLDAYIVRRQAERAAMDANDAAEKQEMGWLPVSEATLRDSHGLEFHRRPEGGYRLTIRRDVPLYKLEKIIRCILDIN